MLKVTATKRKNKIGLMSNNDYYADENLRIIIISEIQKRYCFYICDIAGVS